MKRGRGAKTRSVSRFPVSKNRAGSLSLQYTAPDLTAIPLARFANWDLRGDVHRGEGCSRVVRDLPVADSRLLDFPPHCDRLAGDFPRRDAVGLDENYCDCPPATVAIAAVRELLYVTLRLGTAIRRPYESNRRASDLFHVDHRFWGDGRC